MNFQHLITVEPPSFYLDLAKDRAERRTRHYRDKIKGTAPLEKSKAVEIYKVQVHSQNLRGALKLINENFPNIPDFTEFYQRLLSLSLDLARYHQSLLDIADTQEKIRQLQSLTTKRIKHARTIEAVNTYRREYTGRVERMVKALAKPLEYLRHSRGIMRQVPLIKDVPTVVISGFPNVGKSTILGALTGSTPKIAAFPFTTQQLMLGYKNGIQFIDTPGLLGRPPEERNEIEQHAVLALSHLADVLVFVYDPSETCGYSMDAQKKLHAQITNDLKLPTITVYNKKDLIGTAPKGIFLVEGRSGDGVAELAEAIYAAVGAVEKHAKDTHDIE